MLLGTNLHGKAAFAMRRLSRFFKNYTVQRGRSQHARTPSPMNTRTQTLAPADMEILEVTNGASSSKGTSLTT
jgi:hypothetical protein